MRTEELEMY